MLAKSWGRRASAKLFVKQPSSRVDAVRGVCTNVETRFYRSQNGLRAACAVTARDDFVNVGSYYFSCGLCFFSGGKNSPPQARKFCDLTLSNAAQNSVLDGFASL